SGTNASNTAQTTLECGPGLSGWPAEAPLSGVDGLDLLGNRYVNLHQCTYRSGAHGWFEVWLPNVNNANYRAGTNASSTADTAVECGPGQSGYAPIADFSAVESLDLLDTSRGQGFIEFAFTSEAPEPPACEQTI